MSQVRTPEEIRDAESQCELQQGTLGSYGDTSMLATCRPVEVLCWNRRDDRLEELLECYDGVTLWQAAWWLGVLDDTDMWVTDVVIMKLLRITSMATAWQRSALWMRCLERSKPGQLSYRGVLESCVWNSRINARRSA